MSLGSRFRPHSLSLSLIAVAVLSSLAASQETRLRDGRVLVGPIDRVDDHTIAVETLDGVVTISTDEIEKTRSRAELVAELTSLAERYGGRSAAFAQLELARVARRFGLHTSMWRHLRTCLGDESATDEPHRRVAAFLASLEPELLTREQRDLEIGRKVRKLIRLTPGRPHAKVAAIEHVLAGLDGAGPALRREARRAGSPLQRTTAIRALARRNGAGDDRFVLRTAILDSSADVRDGAAQAAAARGDGAAAVEYLSPGLMSQNAKLARRTAEAFANIGSPAAIPLLVHAGKVAAASPPPPGTLPGGATRGFIAVTTQQSYIRDFDVEVALSSFIANPVVDIVQSGVVLDATVLATITERVRLVRSYRTALQRLAGSDPGKDPKFWAGWMAQRYPNGFSPRPAANQDGE